MADLKFLDYTGLTKVLTQLKSYIDGKWTKVSDTSDGYVEKYTATLKDSDRTYLSPLGWKDGVIIDGSNVVTLVNLINSNNKGKGSIKLSPCNDSGYCAISMLSDAGTIALAGTLMVLRESSSKYLRLGAGGLLLVPGDSTKVLDGTGTPVDPSKLFTPQNTSNTWEDIEGKPENFAYMDTLANDSQSNAGNFVVTGDIKALGFYETSDIRLKENIGTPQKNANKIDIKEFAFKDNPGTHYGVIAQELEAAGFETLVKTSDNGYKSVNYTSVCMLMINDLRLEIKDLKAEIAELKK